jgi:peptidoglycan hydrolase-like protein with peptidoglycan-binding domain
MEKAKASPGNQYTGKLDRSKNSTGPKTRAGVRVFNAAVGVVVDGNNIHDGAN